MSARSHLDMKHLKRHSSKFHSFNKYIYFVCVCMRLNAHVCVCELCVRHCAKQWDYNGKQESENSCSNGACILMRI